MAPRRPARPAVRALPIVAWRRTSCARPGPGSGSLTAAVRQNIFIAWNTLCTSLPLQLSQPNPRRTPACRMSKTGAMPLLSLKLLSWLSTMPGGCHAIDLLAGDPDAVDNVQPGSEQTYVVHV